MPMTGKGDILNNLKYIKEKGKDVSVAAPKLNVLELAAVRRTTALHAKNNAYISKVAPPMNLTNILFHVIKKKVN